MSRAATAGIFPEWELEFDIPGQAEKPKVTIAFEESRKPELIRLVGTDAKRVALEGYCQEPTRLPQSVRPGRSAFMERHGGQEGRFTLQGVFEDQMAEEVDAEGMHIWGIFEASNP